MYRDVDFAGLPAADMALVNAHDFDSGRVVIPDAQLLFTGKYKKAGPDLILTGEDGRKLIVLDYYRANRPDLAAPDGAVLTSDVVDSLAGPANAAQYAQAGAPAGARLIGRVEKVSGTTTVQRSNGLVVELKVGDQLYQGDVVQTGQNSSLGLSLVDGSAFNMGASARMVLNEVVYDPGGGTSPTLVSLVQNSAVVNFVQGSITFVAGKIAKTGEMKLETPTATLGIRGTTGHVVIELNLGTTTVQLLEDLDRTTGVIQVREKGGSQSLLATLDTVTNKLVITPAGANVLPLTPAEIAESVAVAQLVYQVYSQAAANPMTTQSGPQQQQQGPHSNSPNPELDQPILLKLDVQPGGEPGTQLVGITEQITIQTPTGPQTVTTTLPTVAVVGSSGSGLSIVIGVPSPLIPDTNPIAGAPIQVVSDSVTSYDTAALLAGGWIDLGDGLFAHAGDYGAATLNTNATAPSAGALLAAGWSTTDNVTFTKSGVDFGSGTLMTVAVQLAPNTVTYALDDAKAAPLGASAQDDDVFAIPVQDADGTKVSGTASFTVVGVNDAPVVAGPVAGAATAGGAAVMLDALATASDIDANTTLVVVLPPQLPPGVTYDAQTHTFTLDPTDPAYQNSPNGQVVVVQYQISDGLAATDATVSWTVSGAGNQPPVVTASAPVHLVEAVTGDIGTGSASAALTLSDPDGTAAFDIAALSAAGWTNTASGIYTKTGLYGIAALDVNAHKIDYILDNSKADKLGANDHPTESFVVPVTDGTADASTTVVFTIDGRNDAPRVGTTPELSFETGLSTWEISGSVVQVTGGTDGVYAVQLTAGATPASALETFLGIPAGKLAQINSAPVGANNPTGGAAIAGEFFLEMGQTLTFDWNFRTNDYNPFRDFAFFTYAVIGTGPADAVKLSDVFVIGNFGDSGWQSTSFVAPVEGLYRVGFGVSNSGDNAVTSYLKVDNVNSGAGQFLGVTEDASATGTETASRTINFTDPEIADTHTFGGPVFVSTDHAGGAALGIFTAALANDTVNGLGGAIAASYTVSNSAIQFLAAGQQIHETYTYTLDDGTTTATQTVTVTITGANDAPVVSGPVTGDATAGGPPVALDALAHASDVDAGTALSVVLPAQLPPGVSYDAQTHSFTLDPTEPAYANNPDAQTVTVDYAVSDGTVSTAAVVSWSVSGGSGQPNPAPAAAFAPADGDAIAPTSFTFSDADLAALAAPPAANTPMVDVVGDSIVFANLADPQAPTPTNYAQ